MAIARLVGPGEWASYGDIARVALGGGGARLVGTLAAGGGIPNPHRVLLADGRISPGGESGRVEECRRRLEREGISFTGAVADPSRRVTWLDLVARAGAPATLRR